jgi:hypothetical protein
MCLWLVIAVSLYRTRADIFHSNNYSSRIEISYSHSMFKMCLTHWVSNGNWFHEYFFVNNVERCGYKNSHFVRYKRNFEKSIFHYRSSRLITNFNRASRRGVIFEWLPPHFNCSLQNLVGEKQTKTARKHWAYDNQLHGTLFSFARNLIRVRWSVPLNALNWLQLSPQLINHMSQYSRTRQMPRSYSDGCITEEPQYYERMK